MKPWNSRTKLGPVVLQLLSSKLWFTAESSARPVRATAPRHGYRPAARLSQGGGAIAAVSAATVRFRRDVRRDARTAQGWPSGVHPKGLDCRVRLSSNPSDPGAVRETQTKASHCCVTWYRMGRRTRRAVGRRNASRDWDGRTAVRYRVSSAGLYWQFVDTAASSFAWLLTICGAKPGRIIGNL